MFNKELIKHLKDEVKRLQDKNDKLTEQLIVLSGKAADSLKVQEASLSHEPVSYLDWMTGEIKNIPAATQEEKEQQMAAIKEAESMFKTAGFV